MMLLTQVSPEASRVREMLRLLSYEYIGMYGEPDPNPDGGLERAYDQGGSVILAQEREQGIGVCGVLIDEPGIARLARMFVVWEHRRNGVARSMLRLAETEAARLGASILRLETGLRQERAIQLYRSEGYSEVHPFGYYQYAEDSVFLGKKL